MKDILPPPEMFMNLEIPRKELHSAKTMQYRVYSDKTQYVIVDAESAQAALKAGGVKDPLRVVRHLVMQSNVIEFSPQAAQVAVAAIETPVEAIVAAAPEAVAEQEAAEPVQVAEPEAAAADAPLSNDDVEKLLNS
jgi:hypothetical protein